MKYSVMTLVAVSLTLMPAFADEPKDQRVKTILDSPAASPAAIVPTPADTSVQKLADVKKIFIAPLGTGEGAELIRQKIINRLIKSGSLSIAESPEDADATLVGAAEESKRLYFNGYGGGTSYSASLAVRLVSKTKQVLWIDEPRASFFGSRSRSSNVANKMVTDLCKAIAKDKVPIAIKDDKHSY